MMKLRSRVQRGVPTAGQFAAEQRSEPTIGLGSDPQAVANLNRPFFPASDSDVSRLRNQGPHLSPARREVLRSLNDQPSPVSAPDVQESSGTTPEQTNGLTRTRKPFLSQARRDILDRVSRSGTS